MLKKVVKKYKIRQNVFVVCAKSYTKFDGVKNIRI